TCYQICRPSRPHRELPCCSPRVKGSICSPVPCSREVYNKGYERLWDGSRHVTNGSSPACYSKPTPHWQRFGGRSWFCAVCCRRCLRSRWAPWLVRWNATSRSLPDEPGSVTDCFLPPRELRRMAKRWA